MRRAVIIPALAAGIIAASAMHQPEAATVIYKRSAGPVAMVESLPEVWVEPEAEMPAAIVVGEPVPDPEISQDDLYLLAHLICGEAQGYSRECQEAVGSVVLNRVADARYPDTIRKVIYQRGQYACITDGNFDREPTALNWQVAEDLLKSGSKIPATVVYQAQFRQGRGVWKKIGTEIFCY